MRDVRRSIFIALTCLVAATAAGAAQRLLNEEVRCDYTKSNDRAPRLEAEKACLSKLQGFATRVGDRLRLKTESGAVKTFKSEFEACEQAVLEKCAHYWLIAYLPKPRVMVLNVGGWESRSFYLFNVLSGNVTVLEDYPNFSPSGQRFAVAASSETDEVASDVAIYSARSDPPSLEFSYKVPDGFYALYSFVRWQGENLVKLKVYTRTKAGTDPQDFDAEVVLDERGWQLKSPPPGP